jgi:hypothetical protein
MSYIKIPYACRVLADSVGITNILAYHRSQYRANGPPENQMIDTVQARRQRTLGIVPTSHSASIG